VASHCTEQQKASNWQTVLQQVASSHFEVACGRKQLPRPEAPQIEQKAFASWAQSASHATVQQVASMAQVLEQQAATLHPGVAWGVRQSPVAGQPWPSADRSAPTAAIATVSSSARTSA
jgi:hypothetical protein